MVDNFMSAGTNGDADEELPAPYGTGPKNRTTEEHHRSDYSYTDDSGDGWRDTTPGGLAGLDPSPQLPSAPRAYGERGPVPQQPYVPKSPYLPGPGYQSQYSEPQQPSSYDETTRPNYYGDSSSRYDESPFAPSSYQEPSNRSHPEPTNRPYRPSGPQGQPQQGPPPAPQQQQSRPSPFAPHPGQGSNGTPQSRPTPPQQQGPSGPPPAPPRPAGPPASNGVTPHASNGTTSNGWTPPAPTQASTPPPPPPLPSQSNGQNTGRPVPPSNGPAPTSQAPTTPQAPPPSPPAQAAAAPAPQAPQNPPPANRPAPPQQPQPNAATNGYLTDPSAEYESDVPESASDSRPIGARVGARRRADVQQDAPSQVHNQAQAELTGSHRARRAQAAADLAAKPTASLGEPLTPAASSEASTPTEGNASGETPVSGSKRPRKYRIHHLRDMKNRGEKWAMLTAYDQYTAEIFDEAGIPVLLVGDSAANNVFGYETTLRVTVDELIPLARAVATAAQRALVVADLPFGSYQASPEQAFHTAVRFMKEAGVHAVKLEGGRTVVPAVEKLTQAGIPVMAHIGFTPQSEHAIGGYRVQGRGDQAAGLIDDAVALAEAGAFSVVLEMVPGDVAAEITKRIPVPTIGIGAGRDTDAQVLVWQDMAGLRSGPMPRFVKQYADLRSILTTAATSYANEVATGTFPTDDHTF
jgi:3-methyl-2-oxobutanoate hydroxymethyltransferase